MNDCEGELTKRLITTNRFVNIQIICCSITIAYAFVEDICDTRSLKRLCCTIFNDTSLIYFSVHKSDAARFT